jgi:hypothetical protein
MERKDLAVEMDKIKTICKKKIEKCGSFGAFIVSYAAYNEWVSFTGPWDNETEKETDFWEEVKAVKLRSPYMVIYGFLGKGYNGQVIDPGIDCIYLLGKQNEKTICVTITYTKEGNKYNFVEKIGDTKSTLLEDMVAKVKE